MSIQSLKTLSTSISKLKEAATKTVANNNNSKPEAPPTHQAPPTQQPHQQKQSTADLKAKAEALRKQVWSLCVLLFLCDTLFSLFKAPFGALGHLLRWLVHLVLYTDKSPLVHNSYLQFLAQFVQLLLNDYNL